MKSFLVPAAGLLGMLALLPSQTVAPAFRLTEHFGVAHPVQPVEFVYTGGRVDSRNTRLTGPGGEAVPFQQLSNGNILVRTRLPASRRPVVYTVTGIDPQADTVALDLSLLTGSYPATGDAVRVLGDPLPGGLEPAETYFLKQTSPRTFQLFRNAALSDPVDLTSVRECLLQKLGWVVDRAEPARTLYANRHGYDTADAIRVASSGVLPAPLAPGVDYFVIRVDENRIRLAADRASALAGNAIALRTLGTGVFEASVEWTWRLGAGVAAEAPQPVRLNESGDVYEITNGLTGVRVRKNAAGPPFPAPIQGVRLAGGSWIATGPNYLYETQTNKPAGFVTSYSARVVEAGPLLVRMEARYRLRRPEYTYGGGHRMVAADSSSHTVTVAGNLSYWNGSTSMQFRRNGGKLPCGLEEGRLYWPLTRTYDREGDRTVFTLAASKAGEAVTIGCGMEGSPEAVETANLAGDGFFAETISVYAGHKSVAIEDDTDAQLQYFLNFHEKGRFEPDRARYRGHGARNLDCGYSMVDGNKVPYVPYTDATVDLGPGLEKNSSYQCAAASLKYAPVWYLAASGLDTGWYWQLYEEGGGPDSPLAGYYIGRSSRYLSPILAGPGVYTSRAGPAAGVTMHTTFRGPDGRSAQRTRREWALYVGTKADLRGAAEIQPIGIERNVLAGINLTRLAGYELAFPDPADGWTAPYRDAEAYRQLVSRVREDSAFRDYVSRTAPEVRDLLKMWSGGDGTSIEPVVSHLENFARHWLDVLVNRNGNFDSWWQYYQPGLLWEPLLVRALAVLSDGAATPAQKARVKAVAGLAASVFWDNDYVPWDLDTMESTGTANQGGQYAMYRSHNALMLAAQPLMAEKTTEARRYAELLYAFYLHPQSGVPRGSTHYHAAAMDPAVASFLSLARAGVDMNGYPLWKGYAAWLLSALTPPEPRFGNGRKMVSLGDGNTEDTPMHGLMASLLEAADPDLAAELQWGWNAQSVNGEKAHGQFSMPSVLAIDENARERQPAGLTGHYEGYWSVLRQGFGTPDETAVWFVNGGFYGDHRHNDTGQVTIYALAAPLAIDWNANLYNPQTPGAILHNRVLREAELQQPWNTDNLSLAAGGRWGAEGETRFTGFEHSSFSETPFVAADGTEWRRSVTLIGTDATRPLIHVRDRFAGRGARDAKVLTWNLMAAGAVETPAGAYTPIERLTTTGGEPNALPSSGPVYELAPGPQRFRFTGQMWPAHASGGIDFALYVIPREPQRFYVGNWGHSAHPTREMAQYRRANGTPFREQQHILRVSGSGEFQTLLLPWRKGEAPPAVEVTEEDCGLRIVRGDETLCLGEDGWSASVGTRRMVTAFGTRAVGAGGVQVSGGPAEVVVTAGEAVAAFSGAGGRREVVVDGEARRVDYPGGKPLRMRWPERVNPARAR